MKVCQTFSPVSEALLKFFPSLSNEPEQDKVSAQSHSFLNLLKSAMQSDFEACANFQVLNFIDESSQMCLSIENQASCQSSQPNASSTIVRPLSTVCVWQNAFLQTCWSGGSDASADQGWIYDNSTKMLVLATDISQNVCLEICTDESFARGSCSLTDNNVGKAHQKVIKQIS